jgi:hypothetical protein
MKKGGGGFLIFGMPVLSVEHDSLKLLSQATEFAFVLGLLDALQTKVKCLL